MNESSLSSQTPPPDQSEVPTPTNPDGTPVLMKFSCTETSQRGVSEIDSRRLSRDEILNTIQDLLGSQVYAGLQAELELIPGDSIKEKMAEFRQLHSETHVQAMMSIANKAADLIVDDQNRLQEILSNCGAINQTCVQDFIKNFGLKAFRRPLTTEENQSFYSFYEQGSSAEEGLKLLIMRFMQSPQFLFHIETGIGNTVGGRTRLTDFEIASRVSYRLTGSMPDAQLFAAAEKGELQVLANVKLHADRIVETAQAKARMEKFFNYWVKLDDFPAFSYSAAFLEGLNPTGLRDEVLQETRDFISHVVWDKRGSVKELLSSKEAFIKTDRMAALYQSSKMTDGTPVVLGDDRAGLLLRPGFLVGGTDTSAPIGRGVRLLRRVLCDNIRTPSSDIIASRLDELGHLDRTMMSNRQIVQTMTSPSNCTSCHSKINPVGFVFEAYDGLGRKRTVEKVYHMDGSLAAQHPIDTRVDGLNVDTTGPVSIESGGEMASIIAAGNRAPGCFAQHIYRYTRVREEDETIDSCVLRDIEASLRESGGSIVGAFVRNIANDDIFWKKAVE